MKIENGKLTIETKTINNNQGIVIEVNGDIAVSVIHDKVSGLVYCNLFHKDYDEPCASRVFLEIPVDCKD